MSRPRVLCVSGDRATRAAVTLSLTDAPIDVVIAQRANEAVDRLKRETIDAVVIDARTVVNVAALVDTVESETPQTPTFVHWGKDGADVSVLGEVVARADETVSVDRLADSITRRIGADPNDDLGTDSEANDIDTDAADGRDLSVQDLPDDLQRMVSVIRCRLVDVTSPLAVERILREEITASDRFSVAWVGEYDRGERTIVPWLSDPDEVEWPLQRTFGIGSGDNPLLERAVRSQTLQIMRYDADSRDAVPFGDQAYDYGVKSITVAPLAANDELFGVLAVYAVDSISEVELDAIRLIATVASHVLETIVVRGQLEQQGRTLHRYERLVETAGDGMCVLDGSGHFMTVNDALVEMTGYSREGLLAEHASILFDSAGVDAATDTIRSLLRKGGNTDTLELSLETKTGEKIPCEATIAVLTPDGEFHGSVGVLRDVTDRKRRERKLRERNERLDAFARIVSHDLRNPLGVAQGYLDLYEETGDSEYADRIHEGLDRMETIIEDVLAIAREGEWVTDTDQVDLESIAHDAWDHVSTPKATLSIANTAPLEADRSRLLRLLENCFRNSIEHGGASVTVRVGLLESTEPDEGTRGFFIEDDGTGLPEELRDHLFDPSVSSSTEGLGIGLWIVREVATGHGWVVDATESEDGGARFEFETANYCSD
ncbi:hybrid sensor histidine kinase/response regulator [Natrinema halophilum]|uniref:histidine kinase n=1 Tax=Natrinema halophilum TaxID=1699371 RepID=A0A7D5GMZ5_9EURY|nr:PAS domain S-box protein [Natrinema halophilum]QLG50512.1 PAS domain S-box protein [Natrinema halophilum]